MEAGLEEGNGVRLEVTLERAALTMRGLKLGLHEPTEFLWGVGTRGMRQVSAVCGAAGAVPAQRYSVGYTKRSGEAAQSV